MLRPLGPAERELVIGALVEKEAPGVDVYVRPELGFRLSPAYLADHTTALAVILLRLATPIGATRQPMSYIAFAADNGMDQRDTLLCFAIGKQTGLYLLFPDVEAPWAAAYFGNDPVRQYPLAVVAHSEGGEITKLVMAGINPPEAGHG